MIRFSRARRNDPGVNTADAEFMKRMKKINQSKIDDELGILTLDKLRDRVPSPNV